MTYVVTLQSASGATTEVVVTGARTETAAANHALRGYSSPAERSRGWRVLRVLPRGAEVRR